MVESKDALIERLKQERDAARTEYQTARQDGIDTVAKELAGILGIQPIPGIVYLLAEVHKLRKERGRLKGFVDSSECLNENREGYTCTLPLNHEGDHAASDGECIVASWP